MVDNSDIFAFQKKYEDGQLNVSDINENEYNNLKNLYIKQIYKIDGEIKKCKDDLYGYKEQILEYKKRI